MAGQFDVPRWLEPPSESERARIAEATAAAADKSASMIRRAIGMRRMQSDAQEAIQNGVDPITAKQTALFNNADLLFTPEQASQLAESQQATEIRKQASLQAQARLAETANYHSNLAQMARDKLAETTKYHQDKLAQDKANATYEPSIVALKDPVTGEDVSVFRKSPKTSELAGAKAPSKVAIDAEKRREDAEKRKGMMDVEKLLQGDTSYTGLVTNLQTARAQAKAAHSTKKLGIFARSKEEIDAADQAVKDAHDAVQKYRDKVGTQYKVDLGPISDEETPTPTSAPSAKPSAGGKMPKAVPEGTIIKQGNKRFYKIPGDPNDPDSWAELKD